MDKQIKAELFVSFPNWFSAGPKPTWSTWVFSRDTCESESSDVLGPPPIRVVNTSLRIYGYNNSSSEYYTNTIIDNEICKTTDKHKFISDLTIEFDTNPFIPILLEDSKFENEIRVNFHVNHADW